ncbi:MAG: hypothetical protein HFE77_00705 [Clostridiales bacterium]|nr:hypothetical protein [Clostridiales bacterium]
MDNPQDALSALLSNPEALSAALEMAKTFMGSSGAGGNPLSALLSTPATSAAVSEADKQETSAGEIKAESVPAVSSAASALASLSGAALGKEDEKTKLLKALKPFLSPKRSDKVDTVLMLMRTMQLFGTTNLLDWGK